MPAGGAGTDFSGRKRTGKGGGRKKVYFDPRGGSVFFEETIRKRQ